MLDAPGPPYNQIMLGAVVFPSYGGKYQKNRWLPVSGATSKKPAYDSMSVSSSVT